MKLKIFGIFLIVLALIIFIGVAYRNSRKRQEPIVFSPPFMLETLWNIYKNDYWDSATGRTLDKQRGNVTTSEGQSYTMLRAVWQDDKPTFDKTWSWTQNNLQHQNDHLFSWLYGTTASGSQGILTDQGGQNSASDADSDIALALLFASSRWQEPSYATEAKSIITDIWNNEVITINNTPYLSADNLEKNSSQDILVDPSYLSPYSYRIFAKVDAKDNWTGLLNSTYPFLRQTITMPLDKKSSANLPPDWVEINRKTGQTETPTSAGSSVTTDFGYDALRVPFRLALDYNWSRDPRDQQILSSLNFLSTEWQDGQKIYADYSHDGSVVSMTEDPAMYGGVIGYFMAADPSRASAVYSTKLESLFDPDTNSWKQSMNYYDENWAWFGLALYNNQLPDLYQENSTSSATSTAPTVSQIK